MNLGLYSRQNPSSCKCSFPLLLSRGFYVFKRGVNLKWLEIFIFLVQADLCRNGGWYHSITAWDFQCNLVH